MIEIEMTTDRLKCVINYVQVMQLKGIPVEIIGNLIRDIIGFLKIKNLMITLRTIVVIMFDRAAVATQFKL